MNFSDYFTSLVRTWVPFVVGALLSWLTSVGLELQLSVEALQALYASLTAFIGALYYAVFRLLERKLPWAGWFLGVPKPPVYLHDDV